MRTHWRALVAVTALSMLAFAVGLDATLDLIGRVDLRWFCGYALGASVVPLVYGAQIWVVLRMMGYRLKFTAVSVAVVNAWSLGQLTPMRAGDLSLAVFIGEDVPKPLIVGLVGMDKFISVAAVAGAFFAAGILLGLQAVLPMAAMGVAVTACLLAPVLAVGMLHALPVATSRSPGRVARMLQHARDMVEQFTQHPTVIGLSAVGAVLRWLLTFVLVWMLFQSTGFAPHLVTVVAASAVGRLLALIPVSVGGIGLKEPIQIIIYRLDDIPSEAVIAVSVLGAVVGLAIAGAMPMVVEKVGRSRRANR